MFERFTQQAKKVIMLAQEECRRRGHNFVGTEFILLGLIGEGSGIAAKSLKSFGINLKDARSEVENIVERGPGIKAVEIPFTPNAKRSLEFASDEAKQLNCNDIGTEHLLFGLMRLDDSVALKVLKNLKINVNELKNHVIQSIPTIEDSNKKFSESVKERGSNIKSPAEELGYTEALGFLVKVALQGISVKRLCNQPRYRAYNITPQEVEDQIRRQGDIIPKEPVSITLGRKLWYRFWPVELAKLLGLIALELLIFPHLPGILFDATLSNILALTIAIIIVRCSFICLATGVFVPALLLAISQGWEAEKLTNVLDKLNQWWINALFVFIYPALTIILINKINPSLLSISFWYGPLFAAGSVWILFSIIYICFREFARRKE